MALQNNSIMPIGEYLSKTLYIPTYQREYSWDAEELDDFWADLIAAMREKDPHFFGQIVIHNDDETNKLFVIDGQQRTITTVVFLRALQKVYSENELIKDSADATATINDISYLIGRKTKKSNDLHLVIGNKDKDYFIDSIQTGYPDSGKKCKEKSQEKMRKAFFYCETRILEMIKDIDDEDDLLDVLEALFLTVKNNFKVLYMEATRLNEAFIIFETLNARGKDLETADLLKNYIFSKAVDVKAAEKQWAQMMGDLEGVDPTKYIRHLWNSEHDFSREKELYKRIVKTVDTPKKSTSFLNQLATYAPVYHDLTIPEDCNYFSNDDLCNSLIALKNLKARTFYPVVISLAAQGKLYSESDIADIVKAIEVFVFRNYSIGGKVANTAEVFFAKLAKDISDMVVRSKDEIQQRIRDNMLSNTEFENIFSLWKGSNSTVDKYIVRYIFRKVHSYLSATSEVVIDNNKVHIEHIMPQNGDLWTAIPVDVHDEYLWRLGNLALLDAELNREMQNKPFADKKPFFASSEIKPNDEIAKQTDWGKDEIESRQKDLASYAVEIWK